MPFEIIFLFDLLKWYVCFEYVGGQLLVAALGFFLLLFHAVNKNTSLVQAAKLENVSCVRI